MFRIRALGPTVLVPFGSFGLGPWVRCVCFVLRGLVVFDILVIVGVSDRSCHAAGGCFLMWLEVWFTKKNYDWVSLGQYGLNLGVGKKHGECAAHYINNQQQNMSVNFNARYIKYRTELKIEFI